MHSTPSARLHSLPNCPLRSINEPHLATAPRLRRRRHPAAVQAPPRLASHTQAGCVAAAASSFSTNSSVSSSPSANNNNQRPKQQQQQPVIIYTHSSKVICTSPRDFMSIVQKLTGLESAAASAVTATATAAAQQDESSSSSTESCANAHAHAPAPPPHYMVDPHLMPPPTPPLDHAHFVPDIPLFAPVGASEQQLLCASRGLYGGQFLPTVDTAAALGPAVNMHGAGGGAVFSPSTVETIRTTFPDYQLT